MQQDRRVAGVEVGDKGSLGVSTKGLVRVRFYVKRKGSGSHLPEEGEVRILRRRGRGPFGRLSIRNVVVDYKVPNRKKGKGIHAVKTASTAGKENRRR